MSDVILENENGVQIIESTKIGGHYAAANAVCQGTHQVGYRDQRGKDANKPTLGKREANATPIEFMEELASLARLSRSL